MTWERFDRSAERYESWYESDRGRRNFDAETRLIGWLLAACPGAESVLEVGCGCGHFTAWLAQRRLRPVALDRAASMLACLQRRLPACLAVLADGHRLPLRDRAVDLVLLVTTLEFLADPRQALAEAARVARSGIVAVVLNRWSLGALSRRFGPASRGSLLRHARDLSPPQVRALVREAAGARLVRLRSRCALAPRPLPRGPTWFPFGDVVGVVAVLEQEPSRPELRVAEAPEPG